ARGRRRSEDTRPHADESEHPRDLRRACPRHCADRARRGWPPVLRRRELQRHPGPHVSGQNEFRHRPLQPAQDLHDATWRRRSGGRAVGVRKPLEPFLPVPVIGLNGRGYHLDYDRPKSIGKVRAWYGNFALLVRAYAYILRMGGDGLKEVSDRAVLNANYIRHRLAGVLDVPFGGLRK